VIVLGVDTCLSACSVALIDGERVLAARSELMARGHQERLAPLVAEVMAEAGIGFERLERIGVTVGPGSFTGLRVGLAFAKGLALALGIPCVGVGTLEALAASPSPTGNTSREMAAAVDAKRGQVWVQAFGGGQALSEPAALAVEEAVAALGPLALGLLVGSGAPMLAKAGVAGEVVELEAPNPATVALLAAAVTDPRPPRPLYLRAPDARLPS
jgi:tRNA threonylcarbamoyladenosine biosynthesis protein TsaB